MGSSKSGVKKILMRHVSWQSRLNLLIREKQNTPFEWGVWDCAHFGADIAKASLGDDVDYISHLSGRYTTALGSARILKKEGFDSLRDYLIDLFGEPIGFSHAWRGDIAFYKGCCGAHLGQHSSFIGCDILGDEYLLEGLVKVKNTEVKEFFKVR